MYQKWWQMLHQKYHYWQISQGYDAITEKFLVKMFLVVDVDNHSLAH